MGYDNSYTGVNDGDKCPKCGAVKVFSALVCPSCGTSYAASRTNNAANAGGMSYTMQPQNSNAGTLNNFDPNATFSAYKKSLEAKENGQSDSNGTDNSNAGTKSNDSVLSNIAELEKPVELDPIAKKLQEMAQQNASANTVNSANSLPNQGNPGQGVPYGGGVNQGSLYGNMGKQGSPYANTGNLGAPYGNVGNQGATYGNIGAYGSPNGNAGNQGSQYGGTSNSGQQFNGQSGNTGYGSPYSYTSPYMNSGFNNPVPEKSNKAGKIIAAVIVLIFLGMLGFGIYKYTNPDKNENGISYTSGKSESGFYTNEWADIKIDNNKLDDFSYMAGTSQMKSAIYNIERSVKNKNGEVEINYIGGKLIKVGSQTGTVPAVVMMTVTDNSFKAKLSGIDMDEFFNESDLNSTVLPQGATFKRDSDMLLCGHAYRTYCVKVPYDGSTTMDMYICARDIGNRIVLFYLYDIPDVIDINTIKSCFVY